VSGRIRDEDIAAVREKSPIADVIGEHVQLRNAGGGNLKGLCPFHDEKSPSLSVSPARGLFHCFGCGVGGDVIRFVERIEHLTFSDAVERLAAAAGVELRYVDAGPGQVRQTGQRTRLVDAHRIAAAFYGEQLPTPDAAAAREFLRERGFDDNVAARYGCGFAPASWDALTSELLRRGFTAEELVTGGLAKRSERGSLIDRFHRRLVWPIRDISGEVVGFGARRLFDDDRSEAKYLNTPETPLYKKSQLLYGLDLAKREIARQHRAVIVEGYTDVMACHLAGVPTAVATCGTSFGTDHIALVRRLLLDSDAFRGEVIFTFDGDAAGMKAAERAFADDQKFMSHTFIAVERGGLDPCELRQQAGDVAVRDLVAGRIPLVEFVLRSTVQRFDLDTVEGRNAALDTGVPIVARIKDVGLREDYARRLTGLVGVLDDTAVLARVRSAAKSGGRSEVELHNRDREVSTVDDAVASVERETLKVAMQLPGVAGPVFDALPSAAFLVPGHRRLRDAIEAAGGTAHASTGATWAETVAAQLGDDPAARLVSELTVDPLHAGSDSVERYADAVLARMQEIVVSRQVAAVKSRLQRINPIDQGDEHARLFAELISLEGHRRVMRERAIGGS
jgi:DNA primase